MPTRANGRFDGDLFVACPARCRGLACAWAWVCSRTSSKPQSPDRIACDVTRLECGSPRS